MRSFREKFIKVFRELLVIFVGVVLALAGENYVEYLDHRTSEREYLGSLLEELELTKHIYVEDHHRYHQTDSAALVLINIGRTGVTTPVS